MPLRLLRLFLAFSAFGWWSFSRLLSVRMSSNISSSRPDARRMIRGLTRLGACFSMAKATSGSMRSYAGQSSLTLLDYLNGNQGTDLSSQISGMVQSNLGKFSV